MANYKQSDYELLRRRCVELDQQGWKQGPIAQALGLTRGWVSQTLKKYRAQGVTALQWRKPTGAPTRLTPNQLHQLVDELNKGAEQHGFAGAVWTRPRVNEVNRKLFNVSYDPSQVGRTLKKVGWTAPAARSSEAAAESASARWTHGSPVAARTATRTQKKRRMNSESFYMSMRQLAICCLY